jgi:tetratricopeptide (TPR) repeat protein
MRKDRWRSSLRAAILVSALCLLGSTGGVGQTIPPPPPAPSGGLGAYLDLIAAYRWSLIIGEPPNAAVARALAWRDKRMDSVVRQLHKALNAKGRDAAESCALWIDGEMRARLATGHELVPLQKCDPAVVLRAAIGLHTEAAVRAVGRSEASRAVQQLLFAQSHVAALPPSERLFARHWYLAAGSLAQSVPFVGAALSLFRELEGESQLEGGELMALGSAYEAFALLCVNDQGAVTQADLCDRLPFIGTPRSQQETSGAAVLRRVALLRLAVAYCRGALALDPKLPSARLRLGQLLAELGQAEAAAELTAVCREGETAAERSLAHLFLARLSENEGRLAAAQEHARLAVRELPESQAALVALAHALFISRDTAAAADAARELLVSGPQPTDPYVAYRLGVPWLWGSALQALRAEIR